ncbi:ferredoxin reductase [Gulosibacter sp. 10]|uniref:ferredoxin reductase n=1 Tax=Gulosibacter sp. 10 TaxID=1255570 RepID=UPI00097F41E8|nr:ferredoxin reductase [Gulosibacter sp. 10]SJM51866.1 Flavodoxin reductases (ferredoxin-NADPH reductases) family 1 [Gulosibacter sp. 10]
MTVEISTTALPFAERIRGLEMPWNRVLQASAEPAGAAKALGPWHPQEFTAECVETVPEVGDMMTFVFRRTDGAPLAFRSGQYVNIAFPVDGPDADPVDRSYSISSAPTQPWTFAITVKRETGGRVSPWVHEHVRPGTVLEMLGPVGAFHLPDADRRARFLFLAAGSGITPLMSMVRTVHSLPGAADIVLLYHGAAPGTFAFSRELEYLASVDYRIVVYYSLGDRSVDGSWEGMAGRLTASMIEEVAPDANGRQVYACGPEGYLNAAGELLRDLGVDDTSVHMEFFSGDHGTRLEYKAEVELAEEIAAASEESLDGQPAAFDVYGLGHEREARPVPSSGAGEGGDGPADAGTPVDGGAEAAAGEGGPDAAAFDTVGEGALTMTFLRSRLNVRIEEGENVLGAASAAGIRIPMNCQEGMCGSCKSIKRSGEVEMHHQGGIRRREIESGKFLPCCSTARTDLVIEA